MTTVWVIAILLSAILAVLPWIIRRENRRIKLAVEYRDKFRKNAEALLSDDETPLKVINVIQMMHEQIDSPSFVRSVFWDALTGRLRRIVQDTTGETFKELDALRPELRKAFAHCAVNFLIACSFANTILGPLVRRLMLIFAADSERGTSRVAAWEVQRQSKGPYGDTPVRVAA